jgi:hypothetical protein
MFWLFLLLFDLTSSVDAAPFSPITLKLSAPAVIPYSSMGKNLLIPVTVTGTPANVTFLVFTKGKSYSIKNIKNGYLGWHYVNKVDTCLYMSAPYQFDIGINVVTWNGKTKTGATLSIGDYTYYLWGYDNKSQKILVTRQLSPSPFNFRTILEKDEKEISLVNPVLYMGDGVRTYSSGGKDLTADYVHTNFRWTIGNDPDNKQLLETCTTKGLADAGGLAFLPTDHNMFFHDTLRNGQKKVIKAWKWIPNGAAVLRTEWGTNGENFYTGAWPNGANYGPGVVGDGGDNLLLVNADVSGAGKVSQLLWIDVTDGSDVKRIDLSAWWVNLAEGDSTVGGQYTGGPTEMSFRNGRIALGSFSSCTNSLIDPSQTTVDAAVLWVNRNGDYIGDLNFEPTSPRPWVCNDYNTFPRKYSVSMDNQGFVIFPVYDLGAVSFGLYAPDGTGIGYKAFAGETSGQKSGIDIIDYDSPYDGIYTLQTAADSSASEGIWFSAQDSFKGSIYNNRDFLHPYVQLSSPNGGEKWEVGQTQQITWTVQALEYGQVTKAGIDFSPDGGKNWVVVVDSVDALSGSYPWKVPNFPSSTCLIRVFNIKYAEWDVSDSTFFILPSSKVGDLVPKEFSVFQNTPNPFNPKTTITFTLPLAVQVAVDVYNLAGQRVDTIINGRLSAGSHTVAWNAARTLLEFTSALFAWKKRRRQSRCCC